MNEQDYQLLLSEEVFLAGVTASDVRSLWRGLARTHQVQDVARRLASDPTRIRELCRFADRLLQSEYDRRYRHPQDIAIMAALVILEQSPLSEPRNLFARLRALGQPSLCWIQKMAQYCDERFTDAARTAFPALPNGKCPMPFVEQAEVLTWADPQLGRQRFSLQLV